MTLGERGCMTSSSSGPIWKHGSCSALLRRLAFAGHFKDGGRALLHLTDLQKLRKNPIFLRDLIPSDCAPALGKITLRGSGRSGRQPTFGGQHHPLGSASSSLWKDITPTFYNLDPLNDFCRDPSYIARANSKHHLICPCNDWGQKFHIHSLQISD